MNISQHAIALPLTQFITGRRNINSSGELINSSYPIHTTGKLSLLNIFTDSNSILFFKTVPAGLVSIRTFFTNSTDSDSNGNQSYKFEDSPLAVGVSAFRYLSIAQSETDFQVRCLLWQQRTNSLLISRTINSNLE